MSFSDYTDRITIQRKSVTRDAGIGSEIVGWALVATVWAKYEPVRGAEYFTGKQMQAETIARFRMHYRADVEEKMRIVFGGRFYDIDSTIDVGGRRTELELMTTQGLTNG
jgi:SPP1 family predicted phage head-tail adaptor